jgi:hypothetical protein
MAVVISVDLTNNDLKTLDPRHIRFNLGPIGGGRQFYVSKPGQPATLQDQGQAGFSRRYLEVSGYQSVVIQDSDFAFFSNPTIDPFQAMTTKAQIVELMRKGYIIVTDGGAPLTVAQFIAL